MPILGFFFESMAYIVHYAIQIYIYVVVIAALITWVSPDPYNPIMRFLRSVTEPLLYRVRRYLPAFGGIDFSPLVLVLILLFFQMFLTKSFVYLAGLFR
jgi:YggT family protein